VTTDLNARGYVTVAVQNVTPVDVATCVIGVYSPATRRWAACRLPLGVPARRTVRLDTSVGPFNNAADARKGVLIRFDRVVVAGTDAGGGSRP
jgi:hypothetical protein